MVLLQPYGLLLLALAPLAVIFWVAVAARRQQRAQRFGAPAFRPRRLRFELAALVGVVALAGLAAAEPAVIGNAPVSQRSDAEAYVIIDISRSMLARPSRFQPSRFDQAVSFARALRPQLPSVRVGIAALTDKALPLLPPSIDESIFDTVLGTTLWVGNPPPSASYSAIATTMLSLADIPHLAFFQPQTTKRLLIVVSDLESQKFAEPVVAGTLNRGHYGLVLVQVRGSHDSIYRKNGKTEPTFVAEQKLGMQQINQLAAQTSGGRVYRAADGTGAVLAAVKRYLGSGPTTTVGAREQFLVLSPFLLAALLPLLAFLCARTLPGRRRG